MRVTAPSGLPAGSITAGAPGGSGGAGRGVGAEAGAEPADRDAGIWLADPGVFRTPAHLLCL